MATRIVLIMFAAVAAGCGSQPPAPKPPVLNSVKPVSADNHSTTPVLQIPVVKIEKIPARHLPNPVRLNDLVISGGLPDGDDAFAELKELGVATVISVDGAKPDLATAQKYGMKYVHLPHSYDGVPPERAKELAKAVRSLPGTIYIHCHHGKHRSPAAAAVACLGAGFINHAEARHVLALAGTGENYRGLFQSVDDAMPLDSATLAGIPTDFPATAKLPAMAEAMVAIEHAFDHVKLVEKAGWKTPADHPALTPQHEALLLRECFTELLRTEDLKARPEQFQQWTQEAEALCLSLEELLKASPIDPAATSEKVAAITANCKNCHQVYRDKPASKKPTAH